MGVGFNGVEVFNGVIDKVVLSIRIFDWWDLWVGIGCYDQFVIKNGMFGVGVNYFFLMVDGDSVFVDQNFDVVFFVEVFVYQ